MMLKLSKRKLFLAWNPSHLKFSEKGQDFVPGELWLTWLEITKDREPEEGAD